VGNPKMHRWQSGQPPLIQGTRVVEPSLRQKTQGARARNRADAAQYRQRLAELGIRVPHGMVSFICGAPCASCGVAAVALGAGVVWGGWLGHGDARAVPGPRCFSPSGDGWEYTDIVASPESERKRLDATVHERDLDLHRRQSKTLHDVPE